MMRTLIALALAFAALTGMYLLGTHNERQVRVAEISSLKAAHADALANAQQVARDTEAKRQADMAALDAKHTEEMKNAKAAAEATIADLRAGAIRVRDRLTCPAIAAGGAGQAGTSTSMGDAATRGGLQAADAELVLRIAGEADEVAVQLQACQAIVMGDRK